MRRRAILMQVVMAAGVLIMAGRLWQLQVVHGATLYRAAVAETRDVTTLLAPRGEILDRTGFVLAAETDGVEVGLVYTTPPMGAHEQSLLAGILGVSTQTVAAAEARLSARGNLGPVAVGGVLDASQRAALSSDRSALPGVHLLPVPERTYPGIPGNSNPGDQLAANILGYVQDGAAPGDVTGGAGVEKSYNGPLQVPGGGTVAGLQGVNGDAETRLGKNGNARETVLIPPTPGNDVELTIDAKLQAVAQRALTDQLAALRTRNFSGEGGPYPEADAGAVVVIDVRNGQVLAAASEPTYSPSAFARVTAAHASTAAENSFAADYQGWLHETGAPLIDHVISDVAPPGSIFKPITAIAALQAGTITPTERLPCPPWIQVAPGYVLHNWIPEFDGYLDLTQAVAQSCDTFFYRVGAATGMTAIDRVGTEFGLGQLTGQHALYGEDPGQLSSPAVEPAADGPWTTGLTMQSAIGQAFSEFNPLEIADYVAALANGGTLWRPYFVREILSPNGRVLVHYRPQVRRQIPLSASIVQSIHQAMGAVTQIHPSWYQNGVTQDWGTAYWPFYDFTTLTQQYLGVGVSVAGKTGTAQIGHGQTPDGWFISFAPVNHPQIAIVVFVHHANEGFASGAPVAREIYDYYFGLDRIMWKAGKGADIIPSEIQQYFGESQQVPDWFSNQPAATTASSPATATTSGATYGATPSAGHPSSSSSSASASSSTSPFSSSSSLASAGARAPAGRSPFSSTSAAGSSSTGALAPSHTSASASAAAASAAHGAAGPPPGRSAGPASASSATANRSSGASRASSSAAQASGSGAGSGGPPQNSASAARASPSGSAAGGSASSSARASPQGASSASRAGPGATPGPVRRSVAAPSSVSTATYG